MNPLKHYSATRTLEPKAKAFVQPEVLPQIRFLNLRDVPANTKKEIMAGRLRNVFYCGRPGPLGNPYSTGPRTESIANFRKHLWAAIKANTPLAKEIKRLAGIVTLGDSITLACWCHPKPCHTHVIAKAITWTMEA